MFFLRFIHLIKSSIQLHTLLCVNRTEAKAG